MNLILPTLAYEQSYSEYIAELGAEVRYPFPLDFDHHDFPRLLKKLSVFANGADLPEGYVPSSSFWLVEDGKLLGVSNLRHHLNERIRKIGGHIGLGIRPSSRGQGLGSALLGKNLVNCCNFSGSCGPDRQWKKSDEEKYVYIPPKVSDGKSRRPADARPRDPLINA